MRGTGAGNDVMAMGDLVLTEDELAAVMSRLQAGGIGQTAVHHKAAITGDFVLQAREVNQVIRSLRANGIEVTSLHNHMLDDEPRLFFTHFWANDDAVKLARGLRATRQHGNEGALKCNAQGCTI